MSRPNIFPFRIYYEDTDAGGVVYHARYLHFMERARSELLLSLSAIDRPNFVVKRAELDYLHPARLYDQLEVVTSIANLGKASIVFEQIVRESKDNNLIFCRGLITLLVVNDSFRPCRMPANIFELLREQTL